MNERAYAVDILRALAIVGMVFSGYIAWNPDLPAWLFHAQLPPPNFTFDASVPGITWVDLVFPFFLFSMGAAFPLSVGRKLDKGTPGVKVTAGILKRGVLLVFFAIVLGNTSLWGVDEVVQRPVVSALLTLIVWGAFFLLFIRLPRLTERQNQWLNACGVLLLVGMLIGYKVAGLPVSIHRSDIIILVLANVVVAGSFIWWWTRRNLWLRLGIVVLLVALKLGAGVVGSWNETLWNASFAPWLYRMDFLQYLCIVLPGSVAGDLIVRWLARCSQEPRSTHLFKIYMAAGMVTLLFLVNMWGLFTRHLVVNMCVTLLLGGVVWQLLRRPATPTERLLSQLFTTGFFWLLLGLVLEALEGGIKKDPATVSYFFVTAGMASHVILVATVLLRYGQLRAGFLIRCGQNPMVAYTAAGYVVMPLLLFVDQVVALPWLWGGCGCVMSVVRSVIITLAMMLLTAMFTRYKFFWRT